MSSILEIAALAAFCGLGVAFMLFFLFSTSFEARKGGPERSSRSFRENPEE